MTVLTIDWLQYCKKGAKYVLCVISPDTTIWSKYYSKLNIKDTAQNIMIAKW